MLEELMTALSSATRTEDLRAWVDERTDTGRLIASPGDLHRSLGRSFRRSWLFYALCAIAGAGAVRAVLGARG